MPERLLPDWWGSLFFIMENVQHDTLVWFGGEVKALDDSGKIGGYLVLFSGPGDPDLAGDFFTKETDFGPIKQSPVLYHHGLDGTLKGRNLGMGELKIDDVGVWIEAQLEMRDEYEKAIFGMVQKGKLGYSSGTAAHLVEHEKVGKAWHIKSWPLGLDASLTPTPCEPRTKAIPLKSYLSTLQETETKEGSAQKPSSSVEGVKEVAFNQTMENTTPQEPKKEEAPVKSTPQVLGLDSQIGISVEDYIKFQRLQEVQEQTASQPEKVQEVVKATFDTTGAPSFNSQTGTGDTFAKAYIHYLRTGDEGGIKSQLTQNQTDSEAWTGVPGNTVSIKASNDTDMNIGTAADGGNAVPTGHFNQIVARRDEANIANRVGVRNIPGVGTTVNVPIDNEDDGEFVSTAEAATNDRDAPAIGQVSMTLVKYTKMIEISDELMQDEESRVMEFLAEWVGRGMAKTHNQLFIAEAENGTSTKTFAGTGTIAAGEVQDMLYNDTLEPYLDDGGSVSWVTRRSTHGVIAKLQGDQFIYDATPQGNGAGRTLMGLPVNYTVKTDALATGNKTLFLGNWFYMGVRNEPEFRLLRDPYSAARTGQLRLHYYFRCVYKNLQTEAITYGTQA